MPSLPRPLRHLALGLSGLLLGVLVGTAETEDAVANGVVEPMISKLKSLKFATEAAITIIRIDDLIKLTPENPQQ